MKTSQKILLSIVGAVLLLGAGGWWWYQSRGGGSEVLLQEALVKNPKVIDEVEKIRDRLETRKEDPKNSDNLLSLGLAWKTLGAETQDTRFYQESLRVYEEGIEATGRRNTIFMVNAANVAMLLKDYDAAEQYLEEAITVAPGDTELYLRLAEMYEGLNKPKQQIIDLLDRGIKTAFFPGSLEQYKETVNKRYQVQ